MFDDCSYESAAKEKMRILSSNEYAPFTIFRFNFKGFLQVYRPALYIKN